jgi:hypothetical protein
VLHARIETPTYQLLGLFQRPFCFTDGGLAGLAGRFLDLLQLLVEVGLHQLQLGLVAAEALGASFRVDEVGHGSTAPQLLL